jgi:hypothetical protein
MVYHKVPQNSDAWDILRLGIPTSSKFSEIVTPGGKPSKSSKRYMHRLLAEWRNGAPLMDPQSQYQSGWMERGHLLEEQAVKAYEFVTNSDTESGGFVTDDAGLIGASPDRLVGEDGLLEIKCPSPAVHMGYMVEGVQSLIGDYWPQLQGQLLITGRKWVDIVSYCDCPGFPPVVIRVQRDEPYIENLQNALVEFVREMMGKRVMLDRDFPQASQSKAKEPPDDGLGVSDADVDAILAAQAREER